MYNIVAGIGKKRNGCNVSMKNPETKKPFV
jgi:hypothetical protein